MKRPSRRGFTLIELLVVVAIIALLIAILLPSLGKAKQIALRTKCVATLKGWSTATYTYMQDFGGYFGGKPGGGYVGGQWDQDPGAYGIPQGPAGTVDPLNGPGTQSIGPAIYGDQMGHVAGSKARFCPADPGINLGKPGTFYYGNRPLPGYRYAAYRHPGTTGPTGKSSQVQKIGAFKALSNTVIMLDAASANNYGELFSELTVDLNKPGPSGGTVYEGLNNKIDVGNVRNYNGIGWDTQAELKNRHGGYGGVLFLDGHADIAPYSDYVKNIPNTPSDGDTTKTWTLFPQ